MRQSTIALLLVLAATLFAAWFFTTHEKRVRHEFIGYQGEARINDFLAAELLFSELGIEAESQSSLTPSEWLPESSDTIVSRLSTSIALQSERNLLTSWVNDGGHLVLLPAAQESGVVDEFLVELGFRLVEIERNENDEQDAIEDRDSGDYEYIVDLENTRYRIETPGDYTLSAMLSDDLGMIVARRNWGGGYVTIVANENYFTNFLIDQSNHARLLMDTVAGYVEPGKVWFIFESTYPSLWQVIWNNAPYVVASLAIVLLLWLWSIMPMFGPAIRPEAAVRRSIIEHVKAAGHFVWRNHGAKALAGSSTAAIMHEAESRHPGIGRLSAEKQARQIARLTGLSPQEIMDVLVNQNIPSHREFTHNMQALQRIRKKL